MVMLMRVHGHQCSYGIFHKRKLPSIGKETMLEGIFISQEKYTKDLLKRFKMDDCKPIKTPMPSNGHLDLDEGSKPVDQTLYRSMIGSLLYLTASTPDIMFSVCMCAHFQACPKEPHLSAVKRILRYLKHTPKQWSLVSQRS
jgi:hypothetical protein